MNAKRDGKLKVAVIGAGWHSRTSHLPALALCAGEAPESIELTALCDLELELARKWAGEFGFGRVYGSAQEMLDAEDLDACIAVTPVALTAEFALDLIRRGIPSLIEKPPGRTVAEARSIAGAARESGVPVMVSVNRRFEPGMRAAQEWLQGRTVRYVRALTSRGNRTEPQFLTETGIHSVDAVRALGGQVAEMDFRVPGAAAARWYEIRFAFEGGALGLLQVMPTAGHTVERYELLGDGWHALVDSGTHATAAFTAWEGGERVACRRPAQDAPRFILDGTCAETRSFLRALSAGRPPRPTPDDVLPSVEICHRCEG